MKQELERFFGMPFEELLETRSQFTLPESINLQPKLSIRAMVYFNLAKDGLSESDEEYNDAKRFETEYLSGMWGGI